MIVSKISHIHKGSLTVGQVVRQVRPCPSETTAIRGTPTHLKREPLSGVKEELLLSSAVLCVVLLLTTSVIDVKAKTAKL